MLLSLAFCSTPNSRFVAAATDTESDPGLTLTIRSSPDAAYETRQALRISGFKRTLAKAVHEEIPLTPVLTDAYVIFRLGEERRLFRMESSGNLWDEAGGKRLVLPKKLSDKLLAWSNLLRSRHYGELTPWEQADQAVALRSVFTVADLETGLKFRVQRRAGNDHADVQPITREDTKIMKRIYSDQWSWKRRAILVETEGKRLAASMNGMPHGGDGIPDNGFSGHFCIHFLGSSTHRSDHPDPLHQYMIHKAAGQLRSWLRSASPAELTDTLVEAAKDRDAEAVRLFFEGTDFGKAALMEERMSSLLPMGLPRQQERSSLESPLTANIAVSSDVRRNMSKSAAGRVEFVWIRHTPYSQWHFHEMTMTG